jgi:hypothetical protein
MAKFRKKPVVVEAFQWLPDGPPSILPQWFAGRSCWDISPDNVLTIGTLEGRMIVSPGDWVIKGIKNELYPCKPDIFAATYEPSE